MSLRLIAALAVSWLSCSEAPATQLEATPVPSTRGAARVEPPQEVVELIKGHQSLWPIRIQKLEANPGQSALAAQLPIPASATRVWVSAQSRVPTTFQVDGRSVTVQHPTLLSLPVDDRRVSLAFERPLESVLSIEPVAFADTMSDGFEPVDEPPFELNLLPGQEVSLEKPRRLGTELNDSSAQLLGIQFDQAGVVSVRACAGQELAVFSADGPGEVRRMVLESPAWCFSATTALKVRARTLARIRRFSTYALRSITPTTVLDTARGIRWQGAPAPDQVLEITPPTISGAAWLLFHLQVPTGVASVSDCDAQRHDNLRSGPVIVRATSRLCVSTTEKQVSLTLLGAVTPRDEAPVCRPSALSFTCNAPVDDVVGRLQCIPGFVVQTDQQLSTGRMINFTLRVPRDHHLPDGPQFEFNGQLLFRDWNKPVSFLSSGYALTVGGASDLFNMFDVNEVQVEHRFFGEPLGDYETLTLTQAALDEHLVVEALRPLFSGTWANIGYSKGGIAAAVHRRFFPCDFEATIPMVAPIIFGREDRRFMPYIERIGGDEHAACREAAVRYEQQLFRERDRWSLMVRGDQQPAGGPTNALWLVSRLLPLASSFQLQEVAWTCLRYLNGFDPAFEHTLWYVDRDSEYRTREDLASIQLYFYQAMRELGERAWPDAHLASIFVPEGKPNSVLLKLHRSMKEPDFEPRAMRDVADWIGRFGRRFEWVYAEWDMWTGAAIERGGVDDSTVTVVPRATHSLKLIRWPEGTRTIERVQRWLGAGRLPPMLRPEPQLRELSVGIETPL